MNLTNKLKLVLAFCCQREWDLTEIADRFFFFLLERQQQQ